jgi:Mg-chelatase subunit ChlD
MPANRLAKTNAIERIQRQLSFLQKSDAALARSMNGTATTTTTTTKRIPVTATIKRSTPKSTSSKRSKKIVASSRKARSSRSSHPHTTASREAFLASSTAFISTAFGTNDLGENLSAEPLEFAERTLQMPDGIDSGLNEVVFVFDTTGSMHSALEEAKRNIRETCTRLFSDCPNMRIAICGLGDYCDSPARILTTLDFTNNAETIQKFIGSVPQTGGGDGPEAYEFALEYVRTKLSWTAGSRRSMVLIGDAQAHSAQLAKAQMNAYGFENARELNWRDEADACYRAGIKIYAVQAGSQNNVMPFYKSIAARTVGAFVQLSEFRAVTDMLMAIAFHEANVERFNAFEKEVQEQGRMDEGRRRMFRQISTSSIRK